ncbi:MAG: antitoxin [Bryobacteraceae bacterium]
MHKTNLRKVGGSVMLAVPPALLDILDLQPGAKVGVTVVDGRLVVEPKPRPGYRLADLLAMCSAAPKKSKTRRSKAERDWVSGKPAGAELI